jgi:heme exporter protein CcmD
MGALEPGAHWGSVIAAYAATLLIMGLLVVFSLLEARRAKRDLERLEQVGRRHATEGRR